MNLITSPEQLPVSPPIKLVGRARLFNDISGALTQNQAILLYGIPGVGKRALVATLAANRIQMGGSALWFKSERDNLLPLTEGILHADMTLDNLLEEHAPLVVLEGIRALHLADKFIRQQVGNKVPVIVLHETAADGPWDVKIMRRLEPEASEQLFREVLAADGFGVELREPDFQNLLAALDGHPLSIRLAALQVAKGAVSLGELAAQISQSDDTPLDRAMAVIAASFDLLDAASQGLLLVTAASFTDGLSADFLERVVGTSAQELAQTLVARGFVTTHGELPYYELHTLIQRHAVKRLRENGRFFETRQRMLEAIVAFTDAHVSERNEALLQAEINNILIAGWVASGMNDLHATARLVNSLSSVDDLLQKWGYQTEYDRLQQIVATTQRPTDEQPVLDIDEEEAVEPDEIIDAPADETLPGRPKELEEGEAFIVPVETRALSVYSDLEAAFNEAVARRDRPEMARISMQMGQRHLEGDEIGLALDRFEQAMALYQEIGDLAHLLDALEMMALNSLYLRGSDDAFGFVRRGLNIANQLGDDGRRCRFMGIMGDLHASLGDASNAMEAYKRAIKLSRLLEDEEQTGVTLGKLAALYMDYGRYREATVALSQAIALFEAVRRPDLQGRSLGNLGTALGHLGRWHEAGQRHAAALRIARHLGDVDEERFQLKNLAFVAEAEGHFHWAVNYNRQALYLALLDDDEPAIGELSFELGRLLLSDPEAIAQAVVLLELAVATNPGPENQRLLKESRTRLKRRQRSGGPIVEVEHDVLVYTGDAYRHYSGGQ